MHRKHCLPSCAAWSLSKLQQLTPPCLAPAYLGDQVEVRAVLSHVVEAQDGGGGKSAERPQRLHLVAHHRRLLARQLVVLELGQLLGRQPLACKGGGWRASGQQSSTGGGGGVRSQQRGAHILASPGGTLGWPAHLCGCLCTPAPARRSRGQPVWGGCRRQGVSGTAEKREVANPAKRRERTSSGGGAYLPAEAVVVGERRALL